MATTDHVLQPLGPMLKLSNALGAFPPYEFGLKRRAIPMLYRLYNIILILTIFYLSCYQIYGKLTYERFQSLIPTVRLTDYMANGLLITFTLRTTVLTFIKGGKLKEFLYSLESFDSVVPQFRRKKCLVKSSFFLLHLITAGTIIADTIAVGLSFGVEMLDFYLAKNFIYYHFSATIIMIVWFGLEIRFSYKSLNRVLSRTLNGLKNHIYTEKSDLLLLDFSAISNNGFQASNDLNRVASLHNDICDIVGQYNTLFGASFLIFVLYDIGNILNNFVQILVTAFFYDEGDDNSLIGYLVLMNVCWISISLARMVLIAASFEFLEDEAVKTLAICYKMLNEIPTVAESDYDRKMREQILYIAQQSEYRKPYISAAGFFEINLGMMGFIVTSITTYVIVIIEFVSK